MPTVQLSDRAVIIAAGPDAESLLQNVITTDLATLSAREARPGALLTPQGKILFDFLISRVDAETMRLDCRGDIAADFLKRLTLYKLRAKATLTLVDQEPVAVSWEPDSSGHADAPGSVIDRRFDGLVVLRHYCAGPAPDAEESAWHHLRIAHGVAESGADYALGDAFPHDILFDQNGGVALRKGCYVGQEVVSRMHHRGTARRRLVIVRGEGPLPGSGIPVTADGRAIGAIGSVAGQDGLAVLRIDRAAEAQETGTPILAGDVPIALSVPSYARFSISSAGNQEEQA